MRMIIGILIVIAVLSIMPAGVQALSDDGLVAEWHFDEGSGSVLKDSSGNGNDGVIYGATWVEGKYGGALSFDGVNDYIEIPDSPELSGGTGKSKTVELWFNMEKEGSLVTKYASASNKDWGLSTSNVIFYYETGGRDIRFTSGTTISTGEWHHIAFTFERSVGTNNAKLIVYFDGNKLELKPYDRVLPDQLYDMPDTNAPVSIGYTGKVYNSGYFNGKIDEVRIYNRALSAEEVKEQYEQGPTALSLIKTVSPQSIKRGQATTITLTIKNTGSTEIKDIEIADTIPSYLTFIDGETSKRYDSLAPKDIRQISYTLQFNDAGTFNFEPAIATYADDKGNYDTVKSKSESIEVIRSIIENSVPTPKPMNGNVQSASVNLHGEKTDVALGEDVLLKLSAVNIIGNPTMHVQVIIIPPSGWSVTSSEFAKSGAGQYTTTYELESGGGKDIEVRIVPNQIGDDFQVEGRIIYYFGDDVSTREDHTLSLPIKVRAESADGQKPSTDLEESKTPGFGVLVAVIGLLMTAHLIKRK